jgi:hypothetical protein
MAVDEQMGLGGRRTGLARHSTQVAAKSKQQFDIPALGWDPSRLRFDYVVKIQFQPPV